MPGRHFQRGGGALAKGVAKKGEKAKFKVNDEKSQIRDQRLTKGQKGQHFSSPPRAALLLGTPMQ